jgi:hypothetical protein
MKKEITYCDVCKKETQIKTKTLPVIFTTEQTEGRSCKPYLETNRIDICEECGRLIISGNFLYGTGAQGHNQYRFRNISELEQLRHFKDTVIGLWATDRPDLLTDEEKERCHLFQIKRSLK